MLSFQNENSGGMSSAIMKEMKELNAKYQASQKALQELEERSGGIFVYSFYIQNMHDS